MIKFIRHKSRDTTAAKVFLKKKGESNDSGTESDGEILDVDKHQHRNLDLDMETSLSSYADAVSPTDTACSSESSAMMCQSHLLYDQHSSEEELEVINGPSSVAAAEAAAAGSSSCVLLVRGTTSIVNSERGSSSLDQDELFDEATSSKRSSSTLVENRKRSLAHNSDDESRNHLEPILTPVNFRTTPPLEAFKPNRSHKFRSTTPLILSEARCGIENMKLCDNSFNNEQKNIDVGKSAKGDDADNDYDIKVDVDIDHQNYDNVDDNATTTNNGGGDNNCSMIKTYNTSSLKMSNSSHHIYQPLPKYSFHYNSSRSSPASTTGLNVEVRSVSPPAKIFHCAISPKRRPAPNNIKNINRSNNSNNNHNNNNTTSKEEQHEQSTMLQQQQHAAQRLQRPHRPCLDFDKMQQVSLH